MSDTVWLAIIGVVAMALKEYFDRKRASDKEAADTRRALAAAEEVKALKTAAEDVEKKVGAVDKKVDAVAVHTNSMSKEMADMSGKLGEARGVEKERDRVAAAEQAFTAGAAEEKRKKDEPTIQIQVPAQPLDVKQKE